ncbi:MAG: hypothetical protein DI539_07650 [Flavobacterium psychrophilum]|nr:MAG: hypothetical protein DI539_07650 [Flavobacterium psychrophilum]
MSRSVLVLLLSTVFFISCEQTTTTAHVGNRYTLELPNHFIRTGDINKDASVQYENRVKNIFVIGIDETKDVVSADIAKKKLSDTYPSTLEGYSQLILDGMETSIAKKQLPPFEETKIGGLKARIISFEGVSSGNRVYWKIGFIEGPNRFYQIMVWTDAENRSSYEKEMAGIINSFKQTGA